MIAYTTWTPKKAATFDVYIKLSEKKEDTLFENKFQAIERVNHAM